MIEIIKQLASTEAESSDNIISILGIDWMMLSFQIVAFLILVWLLGKFVYPWLIKSIDDRYARISASNKAASDVQAQAESAEKRIAKLLAKARSEANDIIAIAKEEAVDLVRASEETAKKRAQQLTDNAQAQIERDILAAKNELHNETIELVALAVEKIAGKNVSKDLDNELINKVLKDSK
jgi:F-type H+-transporting ATPase subunit b